MYRILDLSMGSEKIGQVATTDEPEKVIASLIGMGAVETAPREYDKFGNLTFALVMLNGNGYRAYFNIHQLSPQLDLTRLEETFKSLIDMYATQRLQ